MTNRLASETSPYLLQHAENPVDWYPWGEEALARAQAEDKPILVSIGYSACHWCHVMEHESFENPEIAAQMNAEFINIKVDREERPDLDAIYMTAVQALTGHGGWPMNVFLTPDGTPFYGGTYFPPDDRQGMPGFPKVLEAVADAYRERREEVDENAEQIREMLRRSAEDLPDARDLESGIADAASEGLARSFDARNGGFGSAPKFPQPAITEFLLRQAKRADDQRAEIMARRSLDRMAAGGIYDQLGGGFARYSVDAVWLVPHFEKMLYDNAQLASAYLAGYQAHHEPRYREVAEQTLEFVTRELTGEHGGFYSTLDADTEGHEGRFYVWTPEEIDAVVPDADAALVKAWFAVTPGGNFEGATVLSTPRGAAAVATEAGVSEEELQAAIARSVPLLLAAREERTRPGRDEKVITAWNGMMLRAFADGGRILNRPDFTETARKNASFLLEKLQRDGVVLRSWKDGDARVPGFLEDYALLIDGLLALYRATLEARWLEEALRLTGAMVDRFASADNAGFFDAAADHGTPITRSRDLHDGATPSGNAVAADVLLRLGTMTGNTAWIARATSLLQALASTMRDHPLAAGRYLTALDFYLGPVQELALAGPRESEAMQALLNASYEVYAPNLVVGYVDEGAPELLAQLPFLQERPARNGEPTAYLCEHFACLPPVGAPEALVALLEQGTGVAWREF
ncbi:MAG: thioredoxin domain-containing protein [Thermomicrobiales bacterium]